MILRLLLGFSVAVAAIVVAALLLARQGDREAAEAGNALGWQRGPRLYGEESLPRDRVAVGRIVNSGEEPLVLSADDFELRDPEGRELAARVQFVDQSRRSPGSLGLGTEIELQPGGHSPLTVSYRLDPRATEPVTVFFEGAPALPLPDGPVLRRPKPAG